MPEYITGSHEESILPDGQYGFGVDDAVEKTSSKGNPMIETDNVIIHNGTTFRVRDYLVFSKGGTRRIDQFRLCTGDKLIPGEKVNFEAEDCIGRKGRCRIVTETFEGRTRNKIDAYLPDDISF